MGGLLVSLTRAWWKRVSFWALMMGSSIASMRSKRSSSYLFNTLMVLFLQQPSLHGVGSSGLLEVLVLEESEDDLYICLSSLSLALLYDSLSERSSSSNLKISFLLGWSLMRVLIRDLALALHSFLK